MRSSVRQVLQHRKDTVPQDPLLIDDVIEHAASEEILECDVISYLVASFHTTGNLLAWCLYYLATHEQVQQKAYEEIVGILGQEDLVTDSNIDRFQ
ncbi:hypothetical protein RRG08_000880 [Elysia crispata]|uniref:Cytochrome P450 n=1 Tax=Elysia crispata TaxID=231223 RepID=A0AAE1DIB6_9GAST|nr:hypothetical protein RRG08_000880 [Elysia crispata]